MMKALFLYLLLVVFVFPVTGLAGDDPVIVSLDFSGGGVPSEISPMHETRWAVEDGVLVGKPATAEQQEKNKEAGPGHFGSNAKMFVESRFEDAVVEFDFRLEDDDRAVVFVGNAPGRSHLFNLNLHPDKASLMRFRDKKLKGDENEILAEVPHLLPVGKWHHVRIVMRGPTVTALVNGQEILSVSHERFAGSKHNPNFRTAGPCDLRLDNIVIRSRAES